MEGRAMRVQTCQCGLSRFRKGLYPRAWAYTTPYVLLYQESCLFRSANTRSRIHVQTVYLFLR